MTARHPYEYAAIRVVPRVERGEFINVGVVLYCQALDFLGVRIAVDEKRLLALDPQVDLAGVRSGLAAVKAVCHGGAAAGHAAADTPGRRFRWLTAPRSTVIQPGPVHTGITTNPDAELEHLLSVLVAPASVG